MLLIIYIPVTRAREREIAFVGGGLEERRERERENKRATSGTSGAASRALETIPVLPFLPRISLSLSHSGPSAQKTRRFIAKERRENVDLSSYVPAWQFVCPRTLRRERLARESRRVRENERERRTTGDESSV